MGCPGYPLSQGQPQLSEPPSQRGQAGDGPVSAAEPEKRRGRSFADSPMGNHAPRPLVADLRDPAAGAMKPCPMKLPAAQLVRLQAQANRLRCYPSALARTLVTRGLDQLDGEVVA